MYYSEKLQDKIPVNEPEMFKQLELIKQLSENFTKEHPIALELDSLLAIELGHREINNYEDSKSSGETVIEAEIPEIQLHYVREANVQVTKKVNSSHQAANIIREIIGPKKMKIQEQFIVLYLNPKNDIIGYYRHSKGGIDSTLVDLRLIFALGLKCLAVSIMVGHNHPSGNTRPSESDIKLTKKLSEAGRVMNIRLLDHVIVSDSDHYSHTDEGLTGFDEKPTEHGEIILDNSKDDESGLLNEMVNRAKYLLSKRNQSR